MFVSLSPLARLLAIGIWNECDDMGAFEWKPLQLKMRLLPVDHCDVPALMAELVAANLVGQYVVDGRYFGAVRNFGRFQRPKKPKSVHPMPEQWRKYAATDAAGSEPDDGDSGSGSEPAVDKRARVPKKSELKIVQTRSSSPPVPPNSEKSPQMEDGGDKGRRKKKESSLRSLGDSASDFDRWWAAYPRKVGKGAAVRAYASAVRKVPPDTLLSALTAYRFDSREQFIPHPATWLNGERWLDEIDTFDPVLRAAGLSPEDFPLSEFASMELH
jgi:hypothetical protein